MPGVHAKVSQSQKAVITKTLYIYAHACLHYWQDLQQTALTHILDQNQELSSAGGIILHSLQHILETSLHSSRKFGAFKLAIPEPAPEVRTLNFFLENQHHGLSRNLSESYGTNELVTS